MQKALIIIRTLREGLFPSFLLQSCCSITMISLLKFVEIFASSFAFSFLSFKRVVHKNFSLLFCLDEFFLHDDEKKKPQRKLLSEEGKDTFIY